jgi:hypothetical protein
MPHQKHFSASRGNLALDRLSPIEMLRHSRVTDVVTRSESLLQGRREWDICFVASLSATMDEQDFLHGLPL